MGVKRKGQFRAFLSIVLVEYPPFTQQAASQEITIYRTGEGEAYKNWIRGCDPEGGAADPVHGSAKVADSAYRQRDNFSSVSEERQARSRANKQSSACALMTQNVCKSAGVGSCYGFIAPTDL